MDDADRDGSETGDGRSGAGADPTEAVESFLADADAVFDEFDKGYVDADVALSRIRAGIEELRDTTGD